MLSLGDDTRLSDASAERLGTKNELLVVTTGNRPADAAIDRAIALASELGATYAPRTDRSAQGLFDETGAGILLIVQQNRLLALTADGDEYAYHPNLATVRGHNVLSGKRDVYLDAADLAPGDNVLDCTLGFGCEAILAALMVGDTGCVTGLESEPLLAAITRDGMSSFRLTNPRLKDAMNRIDVVNESYSTFLARAGSRSYDVVYFDPFFNQRLPGSEESVSPLFILGNPSGLDENAVLRARLVARKRVVIKLSRFAAFPDALEPYVIRRLAGRKAGAAYTELSAA